MPWACVIHSSERQTFKRCRRAWDFSATTRQNYTPNSSPLVFDFPKAIREALAVYYFPGMWNWERTIVLPLVVDGFLKSMEAQKADDADYRETGTELLHRYFDWAPSVDTFEPLCVETEFDARVPDPLHPGEDVVSAEKLPIVYRGRIHMLALNPDHSYWIVVHRVLYDEWEDLNQLVLDDTELANCWGWGECYFNQKISGTIYNEVREVPDQNGQYFRRIEISRSENQIREFGARIAMEVREMVNPELAIYPNPSPANCAQCEFVTPCVQMNEGMDIAAFLQQNFRINEPSAEVPRIGGRSWSVDRGAIPPDFGKK